MKEYLDKKLGKLERFLDRGMNAHVVLTVERYRHIAEIVLKTQREDLTCRGESENMYAAIDQAADRLERQIKKAKEKRRSKRRPRDETFNGATEESSAASVAESGGRIVRADEHAPTLLSVEEAIERLELLKKDFLAFIDADSQEMKVVYKRNDGNYGLIESES